MEYAALLDIEPRKLRAGPEVGGMGRFHYTISLPALPDKNPERVLIHPNVAIPAFGGWLLGGDRGEFGGELMYQVGEQGTELYKLLDDNIEDIYKMPFGYVATAGLAHMSTDSGRMYLITSGNKEKPRVRQLFALPAAPMTSWRIESGDILVNTNEGSVVLTKAERLQHVSCAKGTEDGA